MFHAKVEHEHAKLRTISGLRDSADREEFSFDKRGDVMRVEAPQNQEKFHEGSPAADFALDLIGLGDPQLRLGKRAANERTRFYIELGENEKERQKKLDELLADFDLYKSEILQGMQLALRDIRSYEYDMVKKQWLSHAKRRRTAPETNPVMELRELQNQNQAYLALSLE
ncbi:unnamed protein product [Cylicocyclus nassatus]|uniref:Uncharacterized protein n=1 Tax=Cylicocyclus nassatus TaxID=53992 RepID=A0AA36GG37_CYLNA|nr:unnamed protein product [Cylicocyclus nassatus]